MSAVDTKFYEKKKQRGLYISFGFLVFIILVTGALFLYNKKVLTEVNEINDSVSQVEDSILEIESDEQVQLFRMYQNNKIFFETLSERSQIPLFVTHLQKHLAKHGLLGKGFDFVNGEVSTSISTQTNESGYAYQKVVTFLREYKKDEKALFTAKQVNEFSGYDRLNFDTQFILK